MDSPKESYLVWDKQGFSVGFHHSTAEYYRNEGCLVVDEEICKNAKNLLDICTELVDNHRAYQYDGVWICPFCYARSLSQDTFVHDTHCPVLKARKMVKNLLNNFKSRIVGGKAIW